MKLKNKNVLVLGVKKSGQSAIDFLLKKQANVFAFDDDIDKLKQIKNERVNKIDKLTDELVKNFNLAVLSPGISIYNESVKLLKLHNVKVISEISLGLAFCRGKSICITGSNGKTTTANLVEQIFNYANKKNVLVGNVGNPITSYVSHLKNNYITEISSFQLESSNIKPNIACILNISQNHLDRHFSIKEYTETKFKIFENMKSGVLVLNYDDKYLRKLESKQCEILGKYVKIKPKIVWFSQKHVVEGAFLHENKLYFQKNGKVKQICNADQIKLLGNHNIDNVLASICIAMYSKINVKHIISAITSFRGVEHRLKLVENKNGVDYVDDSKSTTPSSCLMAVKAIKKPIVLIIGGSDKGLDYEDLIKNIAPKIKIAVLTGEISNILESTFKKLGFQNFEVQKKFANAVKRASELSNTGDCVLLSPATASFDEFTCFEQRGDCFIKIVKEL